MSDCKVQEISIDGVKYVRADSIVEAPKPGKRHVLVLDRGWIVAGDLEEVNGRIKVTRAVHVVSWQSGVFYDGMLASGGRGAKVNVRPVPQGFDVPADCELFRTPVADNWGL